MSPYVWVSLLVGVATLAALLVKAGLRLGAMEEHLTEQDRTLTDQTNELRAQTATLAEQDKAIAVLRSQTDELRAASRIGGQTP